MRLWQNYIKNFALSMTPEQVIDCNRIDHEKYEKEYTQFPENYKEWICHICKKSFKTYSTKSPCLHSLLRRNWFKKKDFPKIYQRWSYFNISTYFRWIANQERFAWNINNLDEEKDPNKKFEYTIRWKNIEWTLSSALGDFIGHSGKCNFPHYHFQMRIDGQRFIDFDQFHIPFSEYDLFVFDSIETWKVKHSYGFGWVWIQESVEQISKSDQPLENLQRTDDINEAQFNIHTTITWEISWDWFADIVDESKNTGETIASLVKKRAGKDIEVNTIIEPIDNIPDIAARDPKYRK